MKGGRGWLTCVSEPCYEDEEALIAASNAPGSVGVAIASHPAAAVAVDVGSTKNKQIFYYTVYFPPWSDPSQIVVSLISQSPEGTNLYLIWQGYLYLTDARAVRRGPTSTVGPSHRTLSSPIAMYDMPLSPFSSNN